jgi:hypothetical protein
VKDAHWLLDVTIEALCERQQLRALIVQNLGDGQ